MSNSTKLPVLPPPSDPRFQQVLKEQIEILTGARGDRLDRVVTFRDLEPGPVVKELVSSGLRLGASGASAGVVGGSSLPVLQVPPRPVGLTVSGAFTRMVLSWTTPRYANHSHTEVRRSTENDISSATTVGTTSSSQYIDVVGGGYTGYYWIRHVTTDGGVGPWSAVGSATTPASRDEVLDTMTSTEWQASTEYAIFTPIAPTTEVEVDGAAIRLVAVSTGTSGGTEPDWATEVTALGDTVTDGTVTWQAVEVGKIPFFIDPVSGLVVIDGASIREASIESLQVKDGFFDTMTAAKGVLGEANIEIANIFNALIQNYIRSDSYSPGVSGWTINKDGTAEFQDIIARGDVEASSLKASEVMVYAGNIASLQVDTIHIQDQAVTFPVGVENATTYALGSPATTLCTINMTTTGAPVLIIASSELIANYSVLGCTIGGFIKLDGVTIRSVQMLDLVLSGGSVGDRIGASPVIMLITTPSAGAHTIEFLAGGASGQAKNSTLFAMELKK